MRQMATIKKEKDGYYERDFLRDCRDLFSFIFGVLRVMITFILLEKKSFFAIFYLFDRFCKHDFIVESLGPIGSPFVRRVPSSSVDCGPFQSVLRKSAPLSRCHLGKDFSHYLVKENTMFYKDF